MIDNERKIITQIYAAQSYEEAKALVDVGVDYIGVVVGLNSDFPGVYTPTKANEILRGVVGDSKRIILPFTESWIDTVRIIEETDTDIVHVAVEPEAMDVIGVARLKNRFPKISVMRTIPVSDERSVDVAKQYDGVVDYLLLDSRGKNNQLGVTGEVHDWNISKRIVESVSIPVVLAGGLGPDNVADAIAYVLPFGVDSKTKTDIAGTDFKDIEKVRAFVEKTRGYNYAR